NNYYRFSLDKQRTFARLVARIDGDFVEIDSDESYAGYSQNSWTEVALRVDGTQISAYVNGSLVLSGSSSAHPAGAVGLYVWGAQGVKFDDLSVCPANDLNCDL
ncbi:MAG: hypothetical protein KC561_05315, partial [Myxococcales bacterium]|nr:hypothetical protein [Myxococcales bacterium]